MYECNKVYCADSYAAIKELPDKSVDLIVTDPPYDIPHTTGGGMLEQKKMVSMFKGLVNNELCNAFDFSLLEELDRVMKKRNIYIWCNKSLIPKLFQYYSGSLFDIISWQRQMQCRYAAVSI